MVALTPLQRECLSVIERLTVDHVPPSFSEIADAMGFANRSRVHALVHGLVRRGAIRIQPNVARSIEIVRKGRPIPFEAMADAINERFFDGDADEAAIRRVLMAAWKQARADA